MRCLLFLALAACGAKSEPAATTVATSPSAPAPVRSEAPLSGPWMKLTDGGGLVLTEPARWVCAAIGADGARIDTKVSRTSCTLPVTDLDVLTCPATAGYDAAGHVTRNGATFTWTGDTLATRDGQPVTIERDGGVLTVRVGEGFKQRITKVDVDAQGRVTRVRTWMDQTLLRTPASSTIFAYDGDELVSSVRKGHYLGDFANHPYDLISCATAAAPTPRPRAPLPPGPLGVQPDAECQALGTWIATRHEAARTRPPAEQRARQWAAICRGWGPKHRACMKQAKTHEQAQRCPSELVPFGTPGSCEAVADHEVALVTAELNGRLTVADAAARRALVLADCTREDWFDRRRACQLASLTHYELVSCFTP